MATSAVLRGPAPARSAFIDALVRGARAATVALSGCTVAFAWLALTLITLPTRGLAASIGAFIGSAIIITGGELGARVHRTSAYTRSAVTAIAIMLFGFAVLTATAPLPPGPAHTTAFFTLSLTKAAIVFYSVAIGGALSPAFGILTALLAEALALGVGALVGIRWAFDSDTTIGAIVVVIGALALRSAVHRSLGAEALVEQAVADESRQHLRGVARSQVAAVMHDTILNDLSVLATTSPAPLSPRLEERLIATLALLGSADWLSGTETEGERGEDPVQHAIEHAKGAGLRVTVTGGLSLLRALDPATERALGGAVAQCLDNIQQHANTDEAEVSVLGEHESVSVMVSDSGDGFDVDRVVADRLGISGSVRSRIEEAGGSVRIFARPGLGTTVIMTVPKRVA